MGLLGGMMKAGIAKKVYDEARKPHNQRKIKSALSSITNKGGKGTGTGTGGTGPTARQGVRAPGRPRSRTSRSPAA